MLLSEIREEVAVKINDSSFSDETIDSYINDVYLDAVGRCLVPDLKGMDVVVTTPGKAYVVLSNLSGGFSGVLSKVYNSGNDAIALLNSLETLMDLSGNLGETGDIIAVALEGNTLWYYQMPNVDEVLTVIYYKNPPLLTGDGDSPDYIPQFLHRQILMHGACAICYDKIEGGVEGLKVNTKASQIQQEMGVVKFKEWLGKTRKHYIRPQEEGW